VNLEEIFSFLKDDEETGSVTASSDNENIPGTTVQGRAYETLIEGATLTSDNDVTNVGEEDNENEFRNRTGNKSETGKRKEVCNDLGRGECSPTSESSWKKNKAYFHIGRVPYQRIKQEVADETRLSTGSRSTSPNQQENATRKLLSCKDRCAETRSTKRKRNALTKIGKTGSRTRKSKLPIPHNQRNIRQWMVANDCIKECRTFQYLAGSTSDYPLPVQNVESCASHIERSLSTGSSIGAQYQKQLCQLMNDTSLSDRQEDVTSDSLVADDDDNNRRKGRHLQLAADDRRELPTDACRPLISRHAETNEYIRAVLPPARPETNKKERRYSNNHHVDDNQSPVIVQSTWLETFQSEYSDAY